MYIVSMRKYPEDFINKIICGDCIEVMKEMPDECVDMVLTDIPFEEPLDEVVPRELSRIMKEDSWCVFWFPEKYLPHCVDTWGRYLTYTWTLTHHRYNSGRFCPIGFSKKEQLLIYKKGKPKMQKRIEDVFVYPNMRLKNDINHPYYKHLEMVRFWIDRFTPDNTVIFDPFIGSGTTAVACKDINRDFIGIEINSDYCKIAEERLSQGVL